MYTYVVIALLLTVVQTSASPSPLRFTIDCSSEERESYGRSYSRLKSSKFDPNFKVSSFCDLIHSAIPDAVKDGRFVLQKDHDQTGYADTQAPMSIPPPKGFIPNFAKLKIPKLKVSKLNVPKLRTQSGPYTAPRIGSSKPYKMMIESEEETSAERMELFKKGVQKMLHVVRVLGQIDQYLSERTRIIIDKLTKAFSD